MDYKNKKHIISYLIIGGFIFYVFAAILSAIFIISLPQDDDYCLETIEVEDEFGIECIRYKNEIEELKDMHNRSMVNRNGYLILVEYSIAFSVTLLFFYFIPKWKGASSYDESVAGVLVSVMLAFVISIIAPFIFGWILPAPVEWFPKIFNDIRDAQVSESLRNLSN